MEEGTLRAEPTAEGAHTLFVNRGTSYTFLSDGQVELHASRTVPLALLSAAGSCILHTSVLDLQPCSGYQSCLMMC